MLGYLVITISSSSGSGVQRVMHIAARRDAACGGVRRAARRRCGGRGRAVAAVFPARASWAVSPFSARGAPAPSPHELGNRAALDSVRLSRRATTTPATRETRYTREPLQSNARCTRADRARGENSELVAGNGSSPVLWLCVAAWCCPRCCCWRWRRWRPRLRAGTRPTCARTSPRGAPPAPPVSASAKVPAASSHTPTGPQLNAHQSSPAHPHLYSLECRSDLEWLRPASDRCIASFFVSRIAASKHVCLCK